MLILPTDIRWHVILIDPFSLLVTGDFGRLNLGTSQSECRFLIGVFLLALPLFFKHGLVLGVFDAFVIQTPFPELLLVLVDARSKS